jgi:hypothetical protein
MIRHLLPIILRSSKLGPKMITHEQLWLEDGKTGFDPEIDLSYEDALLDSEIRHSLRAQYGNQEPPGRAFHNLMRAIEEGENQKSEVRNQKSAIPTGGTLSGLFAGFSRARVLSGGVAMLLILSVLGGNLSFLITGDHEQPIQKSQQVVGDVSDRSGAIAVPPVHAPYFAPVYDAEALRHDDPVETLAPPRRDALHITPPKRQMVPMRPGPQ